MYGFYKNLNDPKNVIRFGTYVGELYYKGSRSYVNWRPIHVEVMATIKEHLRLHGTSLVKIFCDLGIEITEGGLWPYARSEHQEFIIRKLASSSIDINEL